MDGCRHPGIAGREGIMARRKGHEGVSRMAREPGRGKPAAPREIGRNGWRGPSGRRCRASTAQGRADAGRLACRRPKPIDDPGRRAPVVGWWGASAGHRSRRPAASRWAAGPGRGRRGRLPRRGVGAPRLRASGAQEGVHAARAPWGAGAREGLRGALGAPACFCHPRHPWGRGADGNADGLLGGWLPKGASPGGVTDDEVRGAYDSLDRRPRKRLGWRCPWGVYHCQSLHLP